MCRIEFRKVFFVRDLVWIVGMLVYVVEFVFFVLLVVSLLGCFGFDEFFFDVVCVGGDCDIMVLIVG